MIGELINTGMTFGAGREAINTAFSGTATFNNFSALTITASTFYSGSTPLSQILSGANIWSASTGEHSIIANNGKGNVAAGYASFAAGTGSTANSRFSLAFGASASATGKGSLAIGYGANASSASANNQCIAIGNGANASATAGNSIAIGYNSSASGIGSALAIFGTANGPSATAIRGTAGGNNAMSLGGTANGLWSFSRGSAAVALGDHSISMSLYSGNYPSGATTLAPYSVILGGGDSLVDFYATRSVIIGMSGFTATSADTVYTTNSYVDGYFDLNPQTIVPVAKAGRMFFSGAPLNRMIYYSGNTANDIIIF